MKQYCLYFKAKSTYTKLPDAQTIFGGICNILIHTQGQDAFQEYIDSFSSDPLFIHSSMIPIGLYPMPQINIFSLNYVNEELLKQKPEKQIEYLQNMKKFKKVSYISTNVYEKYIVNDKIQKLQNEILTGAVIVKNSCLIEKNEDNTFMSSKQLNTHVKKTGYYLASKDDISNELFYSQDSYQKDISLFCVYVKTDKDEEYLKSIFKYAHYFGFGPRHSIGKNSFELEKVEKISICKTKEREKLLLSKSAIDDNINVEKSLYQIDSRLHRTAKNHLNNKLSGRINLLTEGSLLVLDKEKQWCGKLLELDIHNEKIFYYGIGYMV